MVPQISVRKLVEEVISKGIGGGGGGIRLFCARKGGKTKKTPGGGNDDLKGDASLRVPRRVGGKKELW